MLKDIFDIFSYKWFQYAQFIVVFDMLLRKQRFILLFPFFSFLFFVDAWHQPFYYFNIVMQVSNNSTIIRKQYKNQLNAETKMSTAGPPQQRRRRRHLVCNTCDINNFIIVRVVDLLWHPVLKKIIKWKDLHFQLLQITSSI